MSLARIKSFSVLCFLLISISLYGQEYQTVKGVITDQQSEIPLIGATIEWINDTKVVGTTSDEQGRFVLENIEIGRQAFRFSYLGYNPRIIPNVLITAGKQMVLEVTLEESIEELAEVVVKANSDKAKAVNELATISARQFDLEEVTRYSGGANDIARLAASFAGVSTSNDTRNDIVIRGNSPTGVLWRLEGIPIPNPNHFATLGTTGGPVSAINTNLLRNSDFMTSAFPAEYGNAISGVFDLGFRSGNKSEYELTGQTGFTGLELMVEGPIKREHSSFLVSYRHSVLDLIGKIGLTVGTNASPDYKDLSFNFDFGKSKLGRFTLFGIGGLSDIEFIGDELDDNDLFADPSVDSYYTSWLGVLGLKHNYIFGDRAYIRTSLATSTSQGFYRQDGIENDRKLAQIDIDDINTLTALSSYFNKKVSSRFTYRVGVLVQNFKLNTFGESRVDTEDRNGDGVSDWISFRDFNGTLQLYSAYVQSQYKFSESLTLNTGVNNQWLSENNSYSLEPRMAFNWHLNSKETISTGYGLHSQMQALPVLFYKEEISPGVFQEANKDLKFTKSHHFVLGYDNSFAPNWRLKSEAFYQYIFDVPIEQKSSSFSTLNNGAEYVFPRVSALENEGTGENYGIELTIEKFFANGYYLLSTTSLYQSKYTGSDGILRNTAFNNQYVFNLLGGKEFYFKKSKRNALTVDSKLSYAGGRPYTPIDLAASAAANQEVKNTAAAFQQFQSDYLRWDLKIGLRMNSKSRRISQILFVDFQNLTNEKNVFTQRYNKRTQSINELYQIGFFPNFLYRIEF